MLLHRHCAEHGEQLAEFPRVVQAPVNAAAAAQITQRCEQRLRGVPVQYVVGHWAFRHITLDLAPPVLIPRPETEVGCHVAARA